MFKWFKKKKTGQTCSCYCPECRNELIGSNGFVSDEEYVTYKCSECGYVSCWSFDMPVPIFLQKETVDRQVKYTLDELLSQYDSDVEHKDKEWG